VSADEADFETLLALLQQSRGIDLTGYKRPSLVRRIERRLQQLQIPGYEDYRDYLEVHPEEFAFLLDTILINVTSFFRDPPAWEALAQRVVPEILRRKQGHDQVRIWSAGCASGEEAYSLAMVFAEALGEPEFRERVKIYATDIDEQALVQARQGSYAEKAMQELARERCERFFERVNGRWTFRTDLRRALIFGRNDLVQDAPISRLDLLVCRNTLMYFNAETQGKILSRFHFALDGDGRGNGYLFVGRAEMLLTHGELFTPFDLKCRLFAKVPPPARRPVPAPAEPPEGANMPHPARLLELAMDDALVARIVLDSNNALVLANARARVLFGISPRDIGRSLSELEVSYRPADLRSQIEHAYAERRTVTLSGVERRFAGAEPQYLDVVAAPVFENGGQPLGIAVSFIDVTHARRLEEELQRAREEIQTTNEELQSSNEELETTNEELQSSNEELETMNEELQSTNEELQTVNEELRTRSEELNHLNAFFESVLASLRAGAVVVNANLDVLMWNKRAEDLWGLRADEVQGRGLLNLDIGLPVAELRTVIRPCLSGEVDQQEVVLDAVNRRGRQIKCRVTCSPLVSGKKREGVLLMMEEA
jgi:two-component system CheB/CheR fusion protein